MNLDAVLGAVCVGDVDGDGRSVAAAAAAKPITAVDEPERELAEALVDPRLDLQSGRGRAGNWRKKPLGPWTLRS
ncbi:MAG TPA: hypothetical protein VG325_18670 [Solirubrobacteraceae bacterium]|nr:hypothetical protein [Solirubrobacteraceae bacterium]